jgi:hypothetical protein
MNRLLKRLGLFETLDLELTISPDEVSDSLKNVSVEQQITIFNLSPSGPIDYKIKYGEVNQRNQLPIHFDIYPRYYIFLTIGLFISALILSILGIGAAILAFSYKDYIATFGTLSFYLLFLFLFIIKRLKKMQWRVWDVRLDIKKELKKREKQVNNNIFS